MHADLQGAYAIAERLSFAIEGLLVITTLRPGTLLIIARLGVAALTDSDKTRCRRGHAALYEAKRKDKNRTEKFALRAADTSGRGRLCPMGLLDDAIREHLELKRRRGADPTEIERAEREALGPVRRSPEVPADEVPTAQAEEDQLVQEPSEPLLPDHEPADEGDDWEPLHEDVDLHEPARLDHEDLPPYEPDTLPPAPEPDPGLPPHPADHAPEVEPRMPPHEADPPPSASTDDLEQETEEYELEPEGEAEGDVLESTPEFLQDAPDHDRLWFEQRPPRDFDFDG